MRSNLLFSLLIWLILTPLQAQRTGGEQIVQGTVTAKSDGSPLIGVNVTEVDANNRLVSGTVTDFDGRFILKVKSGNNRLVFSYIGFLKLERRIGNSSKIDVSMTDNTQNIKEVVVTSTRRHSEGGFSIPKREIATAMQTIDMKEVEGIQVSSIDDALQGRIAGLDIVANSADPGSGTQMRIRGASSINGSSQPLIVLNGVPYEMQVDQSFDYANSNQEQYANLLSINPDDILEISVLKDAAASAVWGSKGANGVIMITTKRGYTGPTRIEYSYRYTGQIQPHGLKMLNGDDYTMLMKQAFFNPQQDENAANYDEYNYDKTFTEYENYNNNTDWVREVTQIGNINDHYLTLSGGGERATYRISGGYLYQNGTIIGQKYNRLSSRAYLEYRVSDRLKFSSELSYTYSDNQRNYVFDFGGGDSPNEDLSILGIAYKKMPNVSVFKQDASGNNSNEYYNILSNSRLNPDQKYLVNPVAMAHLATNNIKNFRVLPTFRLQYDLLDPAEQTLRYSMYVSFDINNDKAIKFLPAGVTNYDWSHFKYNRSEGGDNEAVTIQTDNNLLWMPKIDNKDHSLMLYASLQTTEGRSNYQGIVSFSQPSQAAGDPSAGGYLSSEWTSRAHWRSIGLLARAHYSYKSKYIFSATVRRDGSTKFGAGKKYGNFPGISLKWILSDEKFMEATRPWLNMLALRPGWGLAGNQPRFEYLHYSRYGDFGRYVDLTAQRPVSLRLDNLSWETTSSFNYGADIGLWEDKIQLDLNYYHKRTRDLLFPDVALPSSSGFGSLSYQNAGTMDNDGWEINLYANRIVKKGNFSVDFRFNVANSINRIVQLDQKILNTYNKTYDYRNGTYLTRIQEGNSFGSIYGFRYLGVYQYDEYIPGVQEDAPVARNAQGRVIRDEKGEALPVYFNYNEKNGGLPYEFRGGDARYEDRNHDGNIDELDIVYLGNSNPLFNGGFGPVFRYKNFSCSAFFNFRVGNKVVNAARMNAENMYSTNNQSIAVNWRWRKSGDVTEIPRAMFNSGYNWLGSDRFVEDGSFLRFKYLTFNYSVPKEKLSALKIDKMNFYLTFNNIFVITGYTGVDPEVAYGSLGVSQDFGQTPRTKDMTLGITIGL
ncbi:MAG: SusC/RagA family TonB-linked outer membrane protein [Paludibacteraceae bacterium]|nr:SusC/RagA family TonB-linked outer membrane protein [Paludibacteraceae bacterium]